MSQKNKQQEPAAKQQAQNSQDNKAASVGEVKATGIGSLPAEQQVEAWFESHSHSEDQQNRAVAIKTGAKALGLIIIKNSKTSPDQTAALRKLRECVMTLVQGISLEEVGR